MDPAEIEFLAESQLIKIVPNFNEGVLYLLDGEFGPFKAGLPIEVPLWVALNLRQRQKCRILQPSWMDPETLEEVKDAERESAFFTKMPNESMFVVAQLIMDVAMQDLNHSDQVRTVLKDIWDIRQAKLRKSVDAFIHSGLQQAKVDHLQLIEMNSVRPLLPETMDNILELEKASAKIMRATQNSTLDRSQLNYSSF